MPQIQRLLNGSLRSSSRRSRPSAAPARRPGGSPCRRSRRSCTSRCRCSTAAMLNEDEAGAPLDPAWPGLARELARMNLSLNFYTQWYWKTDLHNLMHFLSLRADPHAQYEIRAYAEAMLATMQRWVPSAHAAFVEYRMNAASISATGLKVIQRLLAGEPVEQKDSGLSPREWRELRATLGRQDP